MKAIVDTSCISCGACPDVCPKVFRMEDDDLAHVFVDPIPDDLQDLVLEAAEICPVSAIHVEK